MPPTTARSQSGYSAAIEGSNLTETEVQYLFDLFLRQMAEDQIQSYFVDHCQRPLRRVHIRLLKLDKAARKVIKHAR